MIERRAVVNQDKEKESHLETIRLLSDILVKNKELKLENEKLKKERNEFFLRLQKVCNVFNKDSKNIYNKELQWLENQIWATLAKSLRN